MNTTTRPRVGQRLTSVTVPHLPEYDGKPFTVTAVGPVLRGEFQSHQKPDDTVNFNVTEWEHLNPAVKTGDKILAIHVMSVPHAEGRIATVMYDAREGSDDVRCEFEEYVDADGITREADTWYVHEWDLAPSDEWVPAVGDEVIAYEPNIVIGGGPAYPGKIVQIAGRDFQQYMVAGEFNRSGIYFSRVEKAPVEYVPVVGERVRMTGFLGESGIIDGVDWRGTVLTVEGDIWTVRGVTDTFVTGPGYVFPLDEEREVVAEREEETPAVPVEPAIITDLQRQIDTLTRELGRANERVTEYSDRAGKWERDFGRYANAIIDQAVTRRWCDEYERVISEIETDFEIAEIPTREEDVDIEWEETYTVTVTRSATVSLQRGYSESDLDDAARSKNSDNDATREQVLQAVRNGNYSSDEYVDDSAVEA
jgi:hypothetical protein